MVDVNRDDEEFVLILPDDIIGIRLLLSFLGVVSDEDEEDFVPEFRDVVTDNRLLLSFLGVVSDEDEEDFVPEFRDVVTGNRLLLSFLGVIKDEDEEDLPLVFRDVVGKRLLLRLRDDDSNEDVEGVVLSVGDVMEAKDITEPKFSRITSYTISVSSDISRIFKFSIGM
jgi:uncharacterized membrane protein